MLDIHVLKYINTFNRDKKFDPIHLSLMTYFLELSKKSMWNPVVETTYSELKEVTGASYNTIKNRMEDLAMFGCIEYNSKNNYTEVKIDFIERLLSEKTVNKAMRDSCGVLPDEMKTRLFDISGEKSVSTIETSKKIVKSNVSTIETREENVFQWLKHEQVSLHEKMAFVVQPLKHENRHVSIIEIGNPPYVSMTATWVIPSNQLGHFNLDQLDDERRHEFNHLLSRANIRLNKNLFFLLDALDKIFLDGQFLKVFKNKAKKYNASGSFFKYTDEGITVTDKIYSYIPNGWTSTSEEIYVSSLNGKEVNSVIEVDMIEATKEWFRYLHPICEKKDGWDIDQKVEEYPYLFNEGGVFHKTKRPIKSIFASMAMGSWFIRPYEEISKKSGGSARDLSDEDLGIDPSIRGTWAK